MNQIKKTQKQLEWRANEVFSQIKGASFDINSIPANDLIILFQICWAVYANTGNQLGNRLKALELSGTIANIIDDPSLDNSLGSIVVKEMAKYSGYFEHLVTVNPSDEDK